MHAPPDAPPTLAALSLLLAGLSGRSLTLQTAAGDAADPALQRPVLSPTHLLLPPAVGTSAPWATAAVAHAAAHLLYSPPAQTTATLKPMGLAVVSAIEDARVEALLMQRLPGVRRWFAQAQTACDPHGLDFSSLMARLGLALFDERHPDGGHWVDKARTLFAAARQQHGLEDYAAFRRLASILANDLGQMRVRFEPRQYAVPVPYRDDHSYLWHHGATAETPTATLQMPHDAQAAAPARSDATAPPAEAAAPEPGAAYLYPEWDYRLQRARPDWCTVREVVAPPAVPSARSAPPRLRQHSRPLNRSQRLRRQWDGEEIDLDAAIDVTVQRRLALAPDGRLFLRPGRQPRHASVLVLLDLSASTGDRPAGAAHSLLDIERQAALLLARAALGRQDRIAIHGFASNTRAAVHYQRLLDFGAPLDAAANARIHATQAAWSTRIGAALRHATRRLADETAVQRAIVLVTDGAPSDVDVFDGRYLTEDARAAVHEARRAGVQTYCLAVDAGAGAEAGLRRIFGWRHCRLVDTPRQLPRRLAELHADLAAH
jgi:hypothetical protein